MVVTTKIDGLLAQYQKSWADVPVLLALGTTTNTTVNADLLRRVIALGSRDAAEREAALQWLQDFLVSARKSWNDLTDLLCSPTSPSWADGADDSSPPPEFANPHLVIDLLRQVLEWYTALTPIQHVAVTLWIAHCHVYDRFPVTPRLAVTSPVPECGKTTLMEVIETLVPKPKKTDSITQAALYHAIDAQHPTLLVDEGDN